MKSSVAKRSIVIDGHKTSVSVEDAFWNDLKEIAHTQRTTLSGLIAQIDGVRKQSNLSSAIRLFVLEHFRSQDKRTQIADAHPSAVIAHTALVSLRIAYRTCGPFLFARYTCVKTKPSCSEWALTDG